MLIRSKEKRKEEEIQLNFVTKNGSNIPYKQSVLPIKNIMIQVFLLLNQERYRGELLWCNLICPVHLQ